MTNQKIFHSRDGFHSSATVDVCTAEQAEAASISVDEIQGDTVEAVTEPENMPEALVDEEAARINLRKNTAPPTQINMTGTVFNRIKNTIGKEPAETGGILGMSDDVIDSYFFDRLPDGASGATYTPNCGAINAWLKKWTRWDIVYMGAVHSHPTGCTAPSYPDKQYAQRLLDHSLNYDKAKSFFYIPIIQSSADTGEFRLYSYIACYRDGKFSVEPIDLYIDGKKYEPNINIPLENFARIRSLLPQEIMSKKTVICVGAGGARAFVENLARSGVGNFVLIDGDIISETNIATQGVYYSEIGQGKVEVIKERILDINPEANVVCIEKFLNDDLSDDDFMELVGDACKKAFEESPTDILIGGLTDNFYANARAARLALKYGTPYIEAGIYPNGVAAEVIFTYPGVTPSCARCANSGRYKHYVTGGVNNATSDGCPVFTTDILNGIKGFVSLMLLLHNTDTRFGGYLENYKTRNFIQMYFDPFNEMFKDAQMGEVRYYEQKPDHPDNGYEECPDCHGTGNLENMKGKIEDTRKIFG